MEKFKNPIIPGFYPDPSICRVGDDFFLVTSTFEYFPGIPVFHSKNLVEWEQIGHCINRNSQLKYVVGKPNWSGIYAPTIRYHEGIFYVITTNNTHGAEGGGVFYVWTEDPYGEWSDPIYLDMEGGDPELFFDDDGKCYCVSTTGPICALEVDLKAGKVCGECVELWRGSGGNNPEAPHIYKRNGWYYLMIAEGGTEHCHMVTMARSRNVFGPYEECPYNPVLTNRSMPRRIASVGHADLVEDQYGNWWSVCLGTRSIAYPPKHNLGRETMLVPVDWSGEWPVFDDGTVREEIEVPALPAAVSENYGKLFYFEDSFEKTELDMTWNFICNPDNSLWKIGEEGLELFGNEKELSDAEKIAWIGRRQQHHCCETAVTLRFPAEQEGEEAGLTIYMNNRHHYEIALMQKDGARKLIFRRRIGSLWKVEKEVVWEGDIVRLGMTAGGFYSFWYQSESGKKEIIGQGEASYMTTEAGGLFTGNYIGLYAVGNGKKCDAKATFSDFIYKELEK